MHFQLPQNTVFYQLEKTMKLYRKLAQDRIHAAGYEVSVNQLILLIQLNERPTSTQVELSESIFKDFASVARMVDLLVRKGFLARSENASDRRKKDLIPTAIAKQMLTTLYPIILDYRQQAAMNFSEAELSTLSTLLDRLSQNCHQSIKENAAKFSNAL